MIINQQINNNEKGLSVRAKLNSLFYEIIDGADGINKIQETLNHFTSELKSLSDTSDEKYEEFKEQLIKSFDYTDVSIADLMVYINGMNGGVSGFAVDTSFDPSEFNNDKAVTILAGQVGTYTYFKDENGESITITEMGVTIFYRGIGSTYWRYKTIPVTVNIQQELLNALTTLTSLGTPIWSDTFPVIREGKAYSVTLASIVKAFRENTLSGSVLENGSVEGTKLADNSVGSQHIKETSVDLEHLSTELQERLENLDSTVLDIRKISSFIDIEKILDSEDELSAQTRNKHYLVKDLKGKIIKLFYLGSDSGTIIDQSSSLNTNRIYNVGENSDYYIFNGKEVVPIGNNGGSGSGSGYYNITTKIPLQSGYYNLETALSALQSSDEIEEQEKRGMIITFESSKGVWSDYRFIGEDTSLFYDKDKWEEYGSKDTVKKITVFDGEQGTDYTPDSQGKITLNIIPTRVDETVDPASTNPVQNKVIAAEFDKISDTYPTKIRLNTIGDGDEKKYSMSLVTEKGEVLDTSEEFAGGGGGSVSTTKIVLTRITPNLTVKSGDEVKLSFKYDQIDTTTQETTGNAAKIIVTITRGAVVNTMELTAPAGSITNVDVTKFIGLGNNTVRVRAEVGEGEEKQVSSLSWAINVVQLTLTSSFNIATITPRGSNIVIPYTLIGSGNKTLRFYFDGTDIDDRSISSSTANGSFSFNTAGYSHGTHSVQLVAELELTDGTIIKSNSIYFDVMVSENGVTTPIVATRFDYSDGTIIPHGQRPYVSAKQYTAYPVRYAVYNPLETVTKVDIYEGDSLVSSTEISSALTSEVKLQALNFGSFNCRIVCGETVYHYNLNVEKFDFDISEPLDGLKLKLLSQGRSNNDTNKDEWTYNDITTEFTNFNWGGNGWINNALHYTRDAKTVVKYKPLEQTQQSSNNAFAFLVKFKVSEVIDSDAEIIRCLDSNGIGFVITPTEAKMVTRGNSQLVQKMASDADYEIGFVSFPTAPMGASDYEVKNSDMVYLYINGIMSGSVQRSASDGIYQSNPTYIEISSQDSTVLDVYSLRAYNTYLTDDQMLSCFILGQNSAEDILKVYNSNAILDSDGNIGLDKVPSGMRVVIITGKQANGVPTVLQAAVINNKKTKFDVDNILTYVKDGDLRQNFNLVGGCISLQGTSSLAYPIKNYRIYLKNSSKVEGSLYLGCDEQGVGGELQDSAKFSFRLASETQKAAAPVDCFCLKADYAESSSSHNTGMAKLVQNILTGVMELVPPQKYVNSDYPYDVRTTVDGEPCLLFYRGSVNDTPLFLGKYNWNNDKSTEAVFGFLDIPGYHDQSWVAQKFEGKNPTECWEFLNNDYPMGMFLDDDFDSKDSKGTPNWLKVFEARFPDDDDINDQYASGAKKPLYLERLVKWVKSTDTTVAGLSESDITARKAKFRNELKDYFDVNYLCDYYEFTDIFACVDQRVKNMMMAFWYNPDVDKVLAYMIFYDNDTILGVRNDGRLKYSWDIDENTVDPELSTEIKTVYAFAGHDSVLWKNLREQFPEELKAAYIRIRAKLTNDVIFDIFDTQQSDKFCERIYNMDALNKYVAPKTIGVEVNQDGVINNIKYSYLEAMQGSRKAHRHWFVTNRMGLFDAWASTGQYTATDISFKGNSAAGATVKAVSERDFYFEFRRESQVMVHSKVLANTEWSYTYPQQANIGTIFHLFGGLWMSSLDLSGWGGFTDINFPVLLVLKTLKLGTLNMVNNLTELVIGNKLPALEELFIDGFNSLTSLDLSNCTHIREVNAYGCGSLATINFALGAPLYKLNLQDKFKTLVLRSLPNIYKEGINWSTTGTSGIELSALWIENCANLDGYEYYLYLRNTFNAPLKNIRIEVNLEGNGEELEDLYNRKVGGIDANGNFDDNHCKLTGTYRFVRWSDEIEKYRAYFNELNIIQGEYSMICFDDDVSDPANITNLNNKTGYAYGNDYVPNGHVLIINSRRHGYLLKQESKSMAHICQLHDDNFNYYADAESIENATPSKLDGTEGDVFIKEPHYWFKGINDLRGVFSNGTPRKYSCFSSNDNCPKSSKDVNVLTLPEIKEMGGVTKGQYINARAETLEEAKTLKAAWEGVSHHRARFDTVKVDVRGYKYLRYPTVRGLNNMGAIFVDAEGNILKASICSEINFVLCTGHYLIEKIPEGAVDFYCTVYNLLSLWESNNNPIKPNSTYVDQTEFFDCIVLSNSENVEDMEPNWFEHKEKLIASFPASVDDSENENFRSITAVPIYIKKNEAINHLTRRKMSIINAYEHGKIVHLYYALFGTREVKGNIGRLNYPLNIHGEPTYGYPSTAGATAFLGMKNTVGYDRGDSGGIQYFAGYMDGETRVNLNLTRLFGYENFYNGARSFILEGISSAYAEDNPTYTVQHKDWSNYIMYGNNVHEVFEAVYYNYYYQRTPIAILRPALNCPFSFRVMHQGVMYLADISKGGSSNQFTNYCSGLNLGGERGGTTAYGGGVTTDNTQTRQGLLSSWNEDGSIAVVRMLWRYDFEEDTDITTFKERPIFLG